jgi:ribosomal protein L11 methyltransferase
MERVAWVGPERAVLLALPGKKSCRLEVYCDRKSEAEDLRKRYGGEVRQVPGNAWWLKQERTFFMKAGKRFCLASGTDAIPAHDKNLPYVIVPAGMAFGTGEHATTAMCLRQLSAWAPEKQWTMLDAGTGSGVLALAGALLGGKVFAFDFDPESIREARKNVVLNSHIPSVRWKCASIEKEVLKGPYDIVVANLYAGLLQKSLPKLAKVLAKEGTLILSGILKSQEAEIMVGVPKARLGLVKRLRRGKWVCLVLRRA